MRLVALALLIVGAIWLVGNLAWLIGLLLVSTLIVYILHPLLQYLKNRFRLKHGLATAIVFILFILFCLSVISLLIPVIVNEGTDLVDNFPHYLIRFQAFLTFLSQQTINLDLHNELITYLAGLSDNLYQALEYLAEASISLIGSAVDFFLVLFIVFYLLYDFRSVREQLIEITPPVRRPLAREVLIIIDSNVGTFIRGSLIRCLVVGVVTGIVLLIIGMPYALLLALLAGIFNFILYIGPYIAAIPAVLLSFSPLTPSPLLIIAVYVGIQILDGMFLAPLLLGRVVKLKPVTIIISILAGGRLAGLLGMVVAVPIAGIIKGLIDLMKKNPPYSVKDDVQNDHGSSV